ncbi:hypothetical protein [Nannocystis sp. SCPEA4]|uniref:hypothetical protein n=1 Tax=Nannocystis sp. SCPEA4 TaxID=2996787 RepID=UPI00226D7E64|nr:hypothetical protein [Nannocystis sp. SCPEA4]MCY1061749.1 hypothetical protein [Nannocystis sp. SCPEA4]
MEAFPTRQYPYRSHIQGDDDGSRPARADRLHRFILGLDTAPRALEVEECEQLVRDPFAVLLRSGPFPLTGRQLLTRFAGLPLERESYIVAEGGQIAWSEQSAGILRNTRVIVAWHDGGVLQALLATQPELDSQRAFLQVIGWDSTAEVYNFYERRSGTWFWAGNSRHALTPPTRGRGPFDSHVNGALVMKELRAPWLHWSSMAAFELPGLAPDDPLRGEAVFLERLGAEQLERLVRSGIHRWTRVRVDEMVEADVLRDAPTLVRHVLTPTSVNLASSAQESGVAPDDGLITLPITFFIDTTLFDFLEIEADVAPPMLAWDLYRRALDHFGFELRDAAGALAAHGDAHFAFAVPERAFEDIDVVAELVRRPRSLLDTRSAACLLMVDFVNPVWSPRRERLMRYVPARAQLSEGTWSLGPGIAARICAAPDASRANSPEHEFAANWMAGDDWRAAFGRRIEAYFARLRTRLAQWDGVVDLFRLAEASRRRFLARPLAEFSLTLPRTNIPKAAPLLLMREDATVTRE